MSKSDPGFREIVIVERPEVVNERIRNLKSQRSGLIGHLTRLINRISVSIDIRDNSAEVSQMLQQLEETFLKIERNFTLFKHVDDDERMRSEGLLYEQKLRYLQARETCCEYLEKLKGSTKPLSEKSKSRHSGSSSCLSGSASHYSGSASHHSGSASHHSGSSRSSGSSLSKRRAESAKADLLAKQAELNLTRQMRVLELEKQIEKEKLLEKVQVARNIADVKKLQVSLEESQMNFAVDEDVDETASKRKYERGNKAK